MFCRHPTAALALIHIPFLAPIPDLIRTPHSPSPTHSLNQVDSIHQELVCRVSEDARGFRIKMNAGIAGHVSTTGESLNIGDAYLDPRFNQVCV
jgi:hypothetical protein